MISRDEIVWLYRCLLGRDPESEDVIHEAAVQSESFAAARSHMMLSREFLNAHAVPVLYRPEAKMAPAAKSRSRTLALATIVKNEERTIELMLRSVLPVIDYAVVLDTGSRDATRAVARRVLETSGVLFQINDVAFADFSQARNAALDAVPPGIDWSLMIDADEHLVTEDYWRLHALLDADVDGWQLPRFNFYDRAKSGAPSPYPDYQRRLIRNRSRSPIRFKGAVHEEPDRDVLWGFAPTSDPGRDGRIGGPHIHHMGQVDLSLACWRAKHEFYARLRRSESAGAKGNSCQNP